METTTTKINRTTILHTRFIFHRKARPAIEMLKHDLLEGGDGHLISDTLAEVTDGMAQLDVHNRDEGVIDLYNLNPGQIKQETLIEIIEQFLLVEIGEDYRGTGIQGIISAEHDLFPEKSISEQRDDIVGGFIGFYADSLDKNDDQNDRCLSGDELDRLSRKPI